MESFLALVFGLLIGSFLNVCISRWPVDESVVRPRSHCPHCGHGIAWYDNIPLLSYALLRARCRHCRAGISVRYPVVELLTGVLFFLAVRLAGPTPLALKTCVYGALMVGLLFSDLEERILPDEFTLGGALIGLVFAGFVPVRDGTVELLFALAGAPLDGVKASLLESAFGALAPAALLWAGGWAYQKVRKRDGLGFGDVKLLLMAGAFMGLRGALMLVFLGSCTGSIIGYAYMWITKKDPSTYELPFGSFLAGCGILLAVADLVYPL